MGVFDFFENEDIFHLPLTVIEIIIIVVILFGSVLLYDYIGLTEWVDTQPGLIRAVIGPAKVIMPGYFVMQSLYLIRKRRVKDS